MRMEGRMACNPHPANRTHNQPTTPTCPPFPPGLTYLRCSSPHGFSTGGLAALSRLTRLQCLELTDAPRAWTEEDVDAVANMTRLTRLALGGGTGMLRVLLRRIADVNGCPADERAAAAAPGARAVHFGFVPQQLLNQQQQAAVSNAPAPAAAAPSLPAAPAAAAVADPAAASTVARGGSDDGADAAAAAAGGLRLRELDMMFDWMHNSNAEILPTVARLTSLTALTVRLAGFGGPKGCGGFARGGLLVAGSCSLVHLGPQA
jgi:hypothetical protein